jgi:hypothetical protein
LYKEKKQEKKVEEKGKKKEIFSWTKVNKSKFGVVVSEKNIFLNSSRLLVGCLCKHFTAYRFKSFFIKALTLVKAEMIIRLATTAITAINLISLGLGIL